jgi:hypothetical protein
MSLFAKRWEIIAFCAVGLSTTFKSTIGSADQYIASHSQRFTGGNLISISGKTVKFDVACSGNQRSMEMATGAAIHFNITCKNRRIDAIGGDDTNCSSDDPFSLKGARDYFQLRLKNGSVHALKAVSYSGGNLQATYLISGRSSIFPRDTIDVLSLMYDCGFRTIPHK